MSKRLVLASASPRRAELLRQIVLSFEIQVPNVDESRLSDEAAENYVLRMATDKANAAAAADSLTLGADTAVVLDDEILGKPRGQIDAVRMLLALSDRTHTVITGVCVTDGNHHLTSAVATDVTFRAIGEAEALRYWQSGEPQGKAGSYGIQGIGGIFAAHIAGSYSAVVGLPLAATEALLRRFRFDTWRERLAR
ncbi:MAG: Maf family protein [Gammaproteobacteria bacterium]|nr:Maf family protein [Gammaproteobacteria bacterium]